MTLASAGCAPRNGKARGGSRYGELVCRVAVSGLRGLLSPPASWVGRTGERQLRLKFACRGEAAEDMAPLMKEQEKRDGVEASGDGVMVAGPRRIGPPRLFGGRVFRRGGWVWACVSV